MEKNFTDRIPFRVESPRGDDVLGTNTKTGEIISDFDAKMQGVPFQSGIPRDKIQKAIEDALKQEKWVCIEKQDGSTELLTKKDLPAASEVVTEAANPQTPAEAPKEQQESAKENWKDTLKPELVTTQKPVAASQTTTPKADKPKEQWVSKFENIKSATATHKGKGG